MAPWGPEKKEISCEEEREKAGAWQETRRLSMSGVMAEGLLKRAYTPSLSDEIDISENSRYCCLRRSGSHQTDGISTSKSQPISRQHSFKCFNVNPTPKTKDRTCPACTLRVSSIPGRRLL